jgi:uncharacterized protein YbgA (DUF1722 family)/uncharacterized protein YbbK (DUF523 family)
MTSAHEHAGDILPIRLGISTCLLGEKVRFDAGHKKDRYLTDVLGAYFEWVPVCPELEVGMGVPREPVRLVGTPAMAQMVGVTSGKDWTAAMGTYSTARVEALRNLRLSGYILKSDSPSCGMERVKVFAKSGIPAKTGRGLYAKALLEAYPLLPAEEEGRLNDPGLRENFIVRVFSYHRLQQLTGRRFSVGELVRFHSVHKYLMLAHSPKHYDLLGRVVARAKETPHAELRETYSRLFMEGLAVKTTAKKNTNVLQHIMGFLKDHLTSAEKQDVLEAIEDFRRELVPIVVPLTLLRHYVKKHGISYIADQVYLQPHPKELMLRNHV